MGLGEFLRGAISIHYSIMTERKSLLTSGMEDESRTFMLADHLKTNTLKLAEFLSNNLLERVSQNLMLRPVRSIGGTS